jgi:hypothetical protein
MHNARVSHAIRKGNETTGSTGSHLSIRLLVDQGECLSPEFNQIKRIWFILVMPSQAVLLQKSTRQKFFDKAEQASSCN